MSSTPAELSAIIKAEIPSWRKVIEERNVKAEWVRSDKLYAL